MTHRPMNEMLADKQRINTAIDAAISVVTERLMRPHRGWSMACKSLMDRLDAINSEIDAAEPPPLHARGCRDERDTEYSGGLKVQIPTDARYELSCLRESMSEDEYVEKLWKRRYPKRRVKSRKGWPFVRLCDQAQAEARVNVTALPIGLRRKAQK